MHITSTRAALLSRDEEEVHQQTLQPEADLQEKQSRLTSYLRHEFHRFGDSPGRLEFADARGEPGTERIMKQRLAESRLYPNNAIRTYGKPSFGHAPLKSQPLTALHGQTITAERSALVNRIALQKQRISVNENGDRDISQLAWRLTGEQERPFNLDIQDDHYLTFRKQQLQVADLQYTFDDRWKYNNQPQVDRLHTDMREFLSNKYEPDLKNPILAKSEPKNHIVSPTDPVRLLNRLVTAKQSLQKF